MALQCTRSELQDRVIRVEPQACAEASCIHQGKLSWGWVCAGRASELGSNSWLTICRAGEELSWGARMWDTQCKKRGPDTSVNKKCMCVRMCACVCV